MKNITKNNFNPRIKMAAKNLSIGLCLGLSISANVMSQSTDLPTINQPTELRSGEFSEGTITKLTEVDIAEFLPWAQNARKVLEDAFLESKRMPITDRVEFIESEIQSVITSSGSKKYQILMRFALNRGLLLVSELEKEAGASDRGVVENQLDILTRAISVALNVYESDLAFQKRLTTGNNVVKVNYARFGVGLGKSMISGSKNIFDASAQYRIMYKAYEMMNWDLSQDENAKDYSEAIIEVYKTLKRLPENPSNDDKESIKHVRTLNYLGEKISKYLNISSIPQTSGNVSGGVNSSRVLGDFVTVNSGSFTMGTKGNTGDEKPRDVRISKSFEMMKTEVTQKMWKDVAGTNPSHFKGDNRPVEQVSWWSVIAFANEASRTSGLSACYDLPENCEGSYKNGNLNCSGNLGLSANVSKVQDCNGYRLPTEAEWEYAARGGSTTSYSYGNNSSDLGKYAWFSDNSGSKTHDVAKKLANPIGLYDMHGNVWEWTHDWYSPSPTATVDPAGPSTGYYRVLRGGGCYFNAEILRSANRYNYGPSKRYSGVGFRLVRTLH